MTEMTMKERVARAIDPSLWAILDRPEDAELLGQPIERRAHALLTAELAIAAMREPTSAMAKKFMVSVTDGMSFDCSPMYRRAIDAALSEQPQ